MDYEKIIDLDSVTIIDCVNLYKMRNVCAVINDGMLVAFEKDDNS